MIKNRYYKTTVGVPFELAIGKTLGSSAYTDVADFMANGTALELAAFAIDATNVQPKGIAFNSAVSAANLKKLLFFSTLEAAGGAKLNSVTPLKGDTITAELIAYSAPTLQKVNLSLTAGTINAQQELSFKVIETTPGDSPLPTWDYGAYFLTNSDAAAWAAIAAKINLAKEGEFFTAAVNALVAPTFGTVTLTTQTVTGVPIATGGSGIFTAAVPNGNGTIPIIFTGGGGSNAAANLNIVNGVATSVTITNPGTGYTSAPVASIAAQTGLSGITITSTAAERHFKLAAVVAPTRANYNDYGIVYTSNELVHASEGSGTVAHVKQLQFEANVRRGITNYYPDQNATAEEFGVPDDIVTSSGTTQWDIVVITGVKSEDSPTPLEFHKRKAYIFVAVPAGQGTKVKAMFP